MTYTQHAENAAKKQERSESSEKIRDILVWVKDLTMAEAEAEEVLEAVSS